MKDDTAKTTAAAPSESPSQSPHQLEILLIDNPADSRLFLDALTECEIPCHVSLLRDGSEVLSFIRREGTFAQVPHPQLIVLDLAIPSMSAEEVLAALRSVPVYQTVPVIIFSAVVEAEGQRRRIQLGASAFVGKPLDLQEFFAAVQAMVKTWGLAENTGKK